ncbi:phospholipase D delta-like [Miscanthus floridulus]|uniref:phospholipase D delta-like n=1 Tax=Miscanthus floridulus TaxID=154761 RepID=UPI003457AAEA
MLTQEQCDEEEGGAEGKAGEAAEGEEEDDDDDDDDSEEGYSDRDQRSANINQRSLAGSRDTEIAVGAYQPDHTGSCPRGKVHAYRMSLWEEHLGKDAVQRPEVQRPESPGCVRMVNRIAPENWRRYAADDGKGPLQGHLMRYPVHVRADGRVEPLPGHELFPDVGGRVVGAPNNLPDYLTM